MTNKGCGSKGPGPGILPPLPPPLIGADWTAGAPGRCKSVQTVQLAKGAVVVVLVGVAWRGPDTLIPITKEVIVAAMTTSLMNLFSYTYNMGGKPKDNKKKLLQPVTTWEQLLWRATT